MTTLACGRWNIQGLSCLDESNVFTTELNFSLSLSIPYWSRCRCVCVCALDGHGAKSTRERDGYRHVHAVTWYPIRSRTVKMTQVFAWNLQGLREGSVYFSVCLYCSYASGVAKGYTANILSSFYLTWLTSNGACLDPRANKIHED